jgi:hypothetical protein
LPFNRHRTRTRDDPSVRPTLLRLTSLAPDIIEAILRGNEPEEMSLEGLRRNLPVRWDEQRNAWT